MDAMESNQVNQDALTLNQKIEAGEDFLKHLFWKAQIVPVFKVKMAACYQRLRSCALKEVADIRAEIRAIEDLLAYPQRVIDSSRRELELEKIETDQRDQAEKAIAQLKAAGEEAVLIGHIEQYESGEQVIID